MSASGNGSGSASVTIINQSSWSLFSRIIVDVIDRRRVNSRLGDSKSALQVLLSLIEAAQLTLFLTKGKKALTRALGSKSFGYCNS